MKQLEKVQNNTTWAKASNAINNNNDALYVAVTTLEHAAFKNKGYFKSVALLYGAYPTAENGAQAFVYNSSNPASAPYDIYEWVNDAWQDTGVNGGNVNVNLDSKQDTLVGYSESVSGGKATQVAIQGDTIALSGKVSLGNVDDMESAILMSSSQAGAAIAKANTLEQSMSALKSPVKPIHLNSQGKLELNIGKGLYVEDGKLCTTGASGGGGGGTTLSEGDGIRIYNDTISVAYDIDTLKVNSCGGLTVNYGEGLTIKNGKLSAQASVNAGNGLVKKGDALQVSVGTGLLVADDVYVNMGKGLATDNENKVNLNLDEQTLTTDSSGRVIVNKEGLAGNGLKQEFGKLAVNYGAGLALSNKALVIDYGAGLNIQDGKLVSTVQGGKTYVAGDAIGFDGNNINVRYDGVTISTKDTTDKSLHVMLGSGLKQGSNGIDVAVGLGLAIGSDNQIYCTVDGGTTYTAGDGIDISNGKISFKLGTSLESKCGYIQVAISSGLEYDENNEARIRVKAGKGITIPDTGEVKAHLSNGLAFDNSGAIKICDAVLTDISNLKDGKQDKLTFGSGLTQSGSTVKVADSLVTDVNTNKSNIASLQTAVANKQDNLTFGSGLTKSGNTITVSNSLMTDVSNNKSNISALQTTVANIPTYSAGDGINIKNNQISVSNSVKSALTTLRESVKGKQDALTLATGLEWGNTDMIQVKMNAPLNYDNCGRLMLNYDSTLTVSNNKLDVDTSKIAGVGIDLDSDYKRLTIGTKAAKELAGKGLVADGSKMKVKYGSGLTTNSCGNLIVDAANLSVKNATMLNGQELGYANGKVPLYVPFPGPNNLISMGYLRSDYSSQGPPTEDYLKAICKWAIATYPNRGIILLMGSAAPSNAGWLVLLLYSSSGYDATSLLPRYCKGWLLLLGNTPFIFETNNYVWSIRTIASLDSAVAKAKIADKATADANGNNITETYARRFMPTNGLEINSDRELFLPNLTSTLAGNAVDGSKNGAQRVLELSCGAIQIKLSTGLAIDDGGYLYVQDKYVTK